MNTGRNWINNLQNFYKAPANWGKVDTVEINRLSGESSSDEANIADLSDFTAKLDSIFTEPEEKGSIEEKEKAEENVIKKESVENKEEAIKKPKLFSWWGDKEKIAGIPVSEAEEKEEGNIKNENKEEAKSKNQIENKKETEEWEGEKSEKWADNDNTTDLSEEELEMERQREDNIINMLKNELNKSEKESEYPATKEQEVPLKPVRLWIDGRPYINSLWVPWWAPWVGMTWAALAWGITPKIPAQRSNNTPNIWNSVNRSEWPIIESQQLLQRKEPIEWDAPLKPLNLGQFDRDDWHWQKNKFWMNGWIRPEVSGTEGGEQKTFWPQNTERNAPQPLNLWAFNKDKGNDIGRERFVDNRKDDALMKPLQMGPFNEKKKGQGNKGSSNMPNRIVWVREQFSANMDNNEKENPAILFAMGWAQHDMGREHSQASWSFIEWREDEKGRILMSEKKVRNGWTIWLWLIILIIFSPTLYILFWNFVAVIQTFFKTAQIAPFMGLFSGIIAILTTIVLLFAPLGISRSPLSFFVNRMGLLWEELWTIEKNNRGRIYMDMFINTIYILFLLASFVFFIKGYLWVQWWFTNIINALTRLFVAYWVIWVSTLVVIQVLSLDKSNLSEKSKVLRKNVYALLLIFWIVTVLTLYPNFLQAFIEFISQNETINRIINFLWYHWQVEL